ncbi:MAG: hypothetical protein PUF61_07855 [Spirochaetales bacterium]|nr:hypothetical protein [Spirochaetales bacterium]
MKIIIGLIIVVAIFVGAFSGRKIEETKHETIDENGNKVTTYSTTDKGYSAWSIISKIIICVFLILVFICGSIFSNL